MALEDVDLTCIAHCRLEKGNPAARTQNIIHTTSFHPMKVEFYELLL